MENHKMLKEICDLIGYKIDYETDDEGDFIKDKYQIEDFGGYEYIYLDVREIIFTQEFMDKLGFYLIGTMKMNFKEQQKKQSAIVFYCNNPTLYLYNLLGLGQKKKL